MNDKICPNCERLKLELQKAEQEIGRQKRLKRIERNKVKRLAAELERMKIEEAGHGQMGKGSRPAAGE